MEEKLKRFKELVKYFDDYLHGKIDKDETLLNKLAEEFCQLEQELFGNQK